MNAAMQVGIDEEPSVALAYEHIYEQCTGRRPVLYAYGFIPLSYDRRFGGSPDRVVQDGDQRFLLEIKTRPFARDHREEIPVTHLLQMGGLCHIMNLPFSDYCCYTPGVLKDPYELGRVRFHQDLWPRVMYPRLEYFAACVERDVEPLRVQGKKDLEAQIRSMCTVTAI